MPVLLLLAACFTLAACFPSAQGKRNQGDKDKPSNIVFILTDDLSVEDLNPNTLEHMPHLKSLLIHHQVIVPVTKGKLDLGPWQQIFYAEFDGQRAKRLVIKVIGE